MKFAGKDILEMEVILALGCTESVAIALGALSHDGMILADRLF